MMVRSDMKGKGLGYVLMTRIINYARSRASVKSMAMSCARTPPCWRCAASWVSRRRKTATSRVWSR